MIAPMALLLVHFNSAARPCPRAGPGFFAVSIVAAFLLKKRFGVVI
jgi:hypothetical protein